MSLRSIAVLALVAVTSLAAGRVAVVPLEERSVFGQEGRAKLQALPPRALIKLRDGHVVPARVMQRALLHPAALRVGPKRVDLLAFNRRLALVGRLATKFMATAAAKQGGVSSFVPNAATLRAMHIAASGASSSPLVFNPGAWVPPTATGAIPEEFDTVKIPRQQSDSIPDSSQISTVQARYVCIYTLCGNFSNGHSYQDVVPDDAYLQGTGFLSPGKSQLVQNKDGSNKVAPDGNCLLRNLDGDGNQIFDASGQPAVIEVPCPGTTITYAGVPCSLQCTPVHMQLTIMDTWVFDHYETQDGNADSSACSHGFSIKPVMGTDDGVAHNLSIYITYPDPAASNDVASAWPLTCEINVFIKGPKGTDWMVSQPK